MRRVIALGFLLFLPAIVSGQESYTLSATANQVTNLTAAVASLNQDLCEKYELTAANCTQAQVCTAANIPGGAACSPAQARAANVRIWPNTQAGREEFVTFYLVAPRFQDLIAGTVGANRGRYCKWWGLQDQTTKDAECSKVGQPPGCSICP
jgi:hypothetical protein